MDVPSWYTLVVPARISRDVLDRLRGRLEANRGNAEFREQLARQAIDIRAVAPGEFPGFLRTEIAKWGKVVQTVGIKPE